MKHWKACYKVHPQKRKKKPNKETKATDLKAMTRLQRRCLRCSTTASFWRCSCHVGPTFSEWGTRRTGPTTLGSTSGRGTSTPCLTTRMLTWPMTSIFLLKCLSIYISLSLSRTRNVLGSCCEMWVGRDLTWNNNFLNKQIRKKKKKKAWMKLIIIYSFSKILNENEFWLLVSFKHFFSCLFTEKVLIPSQRNRRRERVRERDDRWVNSVIVCLDLRTEMVSFELFCT